MTYVANVSLDWISTLHQIFKHPQIKIGEIKVEANWNLLARDDRMWHSRAKRRIRILRPASQSSLAKWTPRKPMAFTRLQWFKVTHWWRQSHAPRHLGSTKSQEGLQGVLVFKENAMPQPSLHSHATAWLSPAPALDQVRYGSTESSERCFRVRNRKSKQPTWQPEAPSAKPLQRTVKYANLVHSVGLVDSNIWNSENWPWLRARRYSATRTVAGFQHLVVSKATLGHDCDFKAWLEIVYT